jgi:hypothetical protein
MTRLTLTEVGTFSGRVERTIQNPAAGVVIITCQILPDRGFAERVLHWRLRTEVVPLLDVSLSVNEGRLRRLKVTLVNANCGAEDQASPTLLKWCSGVPYFDTGLWKANRLSMSFPEQFYDERVRCKVSWLSPNEVFLSTEPSDSLRECVIDESLSILIDRERPEFSGILLKELSDDEISQITSTNSAP